MEALVLARQVLLFFKPQLQPSLIFSYLSDRLSLFFPEQPRTMILLPMPPTQLGLLETPPFSSCSSILSFQICNIRERKNVEGNGNIIHTLIMNAKGKIFTFSKNS